MQYECFLVRISRASSEEKIVEVPQAEVIENPAAGLSFTYYMSYIFSYTYICMYIYIYT